MSWEWICSSNSLLLDTLDLTRTVHDYAPETGREPALLRARMRALPEKARREASLHFIRLAPLVD